MLYPSIQFAAESEAGLHFLHLESGNSFIVHSEKCFQDWTYNFFLKDCNMTSFYFVVVNAITD